MAIDTSTDIGKLRVLIGDTDELAPQFTDDELAVFLSQADDSLLVAASYALNAWAVVLTAQAHNVQLGDYREDLSARARGMRELAHQFADAANNTPAFAFAETAFTGPFGINGREIILNRILQGAL